MDVQKLKKELRREIRRRLKDLDEEYIIRSSEAINSALMNMERLQAAEKVFVFAGVEKEPQTLDLIQVLLNQGKKVCVPKCRTKPYMDAIEIHSLADLKPGYMGILEPDDGPVTEPADFDFAVVPCMSADLNGGRLGHGGGYYDVFLKNTKAYKLCICFDKLLLESVPMTDLDVWPDAVLTETQLITRK